jgi:DNA-binding transcriptional LysR family regulator
MSQCGFGETARCKGEARVRVGILLCPNFKRRRRGSSHVDALRAVIQRALIGVLPHVDARSAVRLAPVLVKPLAVLASAEMATWRTRRRVSGFS